MVKGRIYLLLGKERFLKDEFLAELRKDIFPSGSNPDLNIQEFNAENDAPGRMLEFVRTSPFLSEKRMAVFRGVDALDGDEQNALLESLDSLPSFSVVVLESEETGVKKSGFLKAVSEKARLVACHAPFDKDFPSWIEQRARKHGIRLQRDAVFFLLERTGKEVSALDAALEQSALYVHPRTEVARQDVERLLGRSAQADVFELTDFLLTRDVRLSLEAVESLLVEGQKVYEVVAVLASQLDRLKKASAWLAQGRSPQEVGGELRVHPFFLEKFIRQVRALSTEAAENFSEALLECDEAVKTSALPDRLAVERLVLRICLNLKEAPARFT